MIDCRDVERTIWTEGPDAAPGEHVAGCAFCRAEARRAADLGAALQGMRNRFAVPPPTLEAQLIEALTRTRLAGARGLVTHPKFLRGAALGAAAAAAAATAALGLIAVRRRSAAADAAA